MKVETLTPEVHAVPGTTVDCRLRVTNEASSPATLAVRIYGLGADDAVGLAIDPIPAGEAIDFDVPLAIPETFSDGRHALAVEVRSDRQGEGVMLAPVTVRVASLDRVLLRVVPAVLRGRRSKRFRVELDNRRDEAVDVLLAGEGPELEVQLAPIHVQLQPSERRSVDGRVRGPRHVVGDELQHIVTVSAHGAAVPSYATASFTQRPTIARGLRRLMAGLALVALWAGVVGAGAYWWSQRGTSKPSGQQTATSTSVNGSSVPGSTPAGGTAAGSGGSGGGGGGGGGGSGGGGAPVPSGVTVGAPTATLIRGTVKAGATGANGDVIVTLTPLVAGQPESTTVANATQPSTLRSSLMRSTVVDTTSGAVSVSDPNGGEEQTKYWSVRGGRYSGGVRLLGARATLSQPSTTNSATDGAFKFADVPLRRSYEVSFAKPGFDTQSFQVTPPDDGKTVEMKVVLQPGKGALGGVVYGPGGALLGGVKLSITDGTLTFLTTSSTDTNGKGQWMIEGISTPGTYTVMATIDGYSTQVAEVTLQPKERNTTLALTMSNGLGSISGTVRGASGPLGGVTLTASNGTTTRTTTSFTAGATGSYLFPNLPIPGTYTVTATAPGYATQTRLVALSGNSAAIDFQMVTTFATITGVVMSADPTGSRPPEPLPNASIEVDQGALKVRSTSAVAPDPGSFTVGDLPPGDYTVTFGRYDHTSESRPITLTAGQLLDLGQIVLTYTPRAPLQASGSLSLTINQLVNGSPVPLDQVSTTLTDIAGRIAIPNPPARSITGSFKYTNIPIGTYRLLVERDGYRPFTVPRINIGLGNVDLPVTMLKFGQAFGQVVDPVATPAQPLDDYQLLLYQDLHPGLLCKALITVPPGQPLDGQGKIRWQVREDLQLLSGDYVIRFRPAPGDTGTPCATGGRLPSGHTDQPDPNGNVGTFTIATDNDNPIELPDIPVYPYPVVRGLVLAPRFNAGAVTFVGLDSLVAADLAVTLDCGTGSVATATLTRAGNSAAFTFDRAKVAALFGSAPLPPGGVLPICTLHASAATFATVTAPLPSALMIATAAPYQDRVANIALVDDPDVLLGTAYWTDAASGAPVYLGGMSVDAPGAIVAFGARETTDPDGTGPLNPTAPDPSQVTADLHTTTAPGTGFWSFPGVRQVFGVATYTFTHPNAVTGSFDLTITESGRTITASSGLAQPVVDDGNLDIVVVPKPGAIHGSVSIVTTRNPVPFNEVRIHATPPGATAIDVPVDAAGNYAIDPAAAGTWSLDPTAVPGSNLVPDVGQGAQQPFVDAANTTVTALPRQYVELGQVQTDFVDSNNVSVPTYTVAGVSYPQMTVALVPSFAPFPTWTDESATSASGTALAQHLSVSTVLPTLFPMTYRITYTMPNYELTRATWQVFDEAGNVVSSGSGTPNISVSVLAGTRLRIAMKVPAFGSISGVVRGLLNPPSTAPTDIENLDLNTGLTVTAHRVQDAAGTEFVPQAPNEVVSRTNGTPSGFSFTVPAGYYRITYSDPDFDSKSQVVQVVEGTNTDASIDLEIARGSFELTVVTDEVSLTPVDGATVRLWPAGTPIGSIGSTPPSYQGTTTNGFIDFDPSTTPSTGIIPGSYLVVVRKADPLNPTRDENFPVIATVSVPRGSTPALRTVAKRAVMPQTDGGITGTVYATNGFRPVKLPAFTVTRTFTTPQATGPNALPNVATDADQQRLAQQSTRPFPTPSGSSQGYLFGELAAGVHTLSFSTAGGYTKPPDIPVTVDGASTATAADATYIANSVQVRITLTGLVAGTSHPDVGVSLTSPAGGAALPGTEDPNQSGTWVFDAVLPESNNYTITITAAHYTATTPAQLSFEVPPSAVAVPHTVAVTASSAITGTATKRLTASTTGPVTETNSVQLIRVSDGAVLATTTPNSGGGYSFTVTSVQTLQVRATVAGFKTGTSTVPSYALDQTVNVPTVFVDKYATVTMTVGGAPAGTATVTPSPSTGVTVTQSPPGVYAITGLDPAVGYTFDIAATGYLTETYPTTGTFTPPIGSNTPVTVTLELPKTISGQTLKASVGTASTVSLYRNNNLVAGPTATAGDGTFSFSGLNNGTYTISAVSNGVGAGQRTGVTLTHGSPSASGQDVTLTARSLTVQFAITPAAAVPTITINGATGSAGQTSFTFPEDGDRSFSITAPGYLADSGTVSITSWDGTSTVSVPRTLTPIDVTGTVTGAAGNFPATVYLCAGTVTTATTCGTSTVTDTVAATGGGFSFSAVAAGSYKVVAKDGSGTFTPLVAVTVSAAGTVTPSPLTLAFP